MSDKSRFNYSKTEDRKINELVGICTGILADGSLNDAEIMFIMAWLKKNKSYKDTWPISILYSQITKTLEDGVIDEEERSLLIATMTEFADFSPVCEQPAVSLPLCTDPAPIIYKGKTFVLTGDFIAGTRTNCEKEIEHQGGTTQKRVTLKTDYLIIGDKGSSDWVHQTFGRKIERAVQLRDNGHKIAIISEQNWIESLKDIT